MWGTSLNKNDLNLALNLIKLLLCLNKIYGIGQVDAKEVIIVLFSLLYKGMKKIYNPW